ncbi:hypothetical protein SJ05684_b48760 (plasmid) [Sinorhizobium sojae CCBAU 05684]|uniref:Uncharacterized protein n=1 Tax=Sinorhizobium sojae CCBAU 05684 TaxID=716928 RepID=A0A249PIX3_9HYPH|nr:hypothetical protein SJ05684_b48760 [Sinorhizobium sojae CCBAU 05684]
MIVACHDSSDTCGVHGCGLVPTPNLPFGPFRHNTRSGRKECRTGSTEAPGRVVNGKAWVGNDYPWVSFGCGRFGGSERVS